MNPSKLIAVALLLSSVLGCGQSSKPAAAPEARSYKATLSLDGLALECRAGGALYQSTLVPLNKLPLANAVMEVRHGKTLGPWCLITLHMNPSTSIYVVWNPDTGVTHVSPGNVPPVTVPGCDALALVTFGPESKATAIPERSCYSLWVNGVKLYDHLPQYDWRVIQIEKNRIEWEGTVDWSRKDEDDPYGISKTGAWIVFSGNWTSPSKKTYQVYYIYNCLKMMTSGCNLRGCHRLLFVRDGKVALYLGSVNDGIKVENNQLLQKTGPCGKRTYVPWSEADLWTKDL